ncbi:UDP-N-acetylmuramoyl-tripeptide--D-alanyl-D-alanine ligase [Agilicoccus flavus]|uniref:UDP-N-acetylmuramoyl-tripeptide--D-alanyl-D- alanine ligase n=1 Tax=Agilicoccus flavus TaxID=2775968 RepID=UPI001CF66515|nr:UDP-N-acetylmuramoyl-tripeptide--D-alanyl-D-alanine ligase [Agilicoccus flavus]
MIPLTLTRIADVVGGRLHGADALVDGPVVTDSREAGPGSLYVARVGERADGHDFAAAAAAAGAVGALTTRPLPDLPCVVVDDVQEAFAALASEVIACVPGLTVVGVTGSSGKTTTKDLLAAVLARHGETVANVGSLNSEVGVPLTVCRVTPTTRVLVLEMGARGLGHLTYLTDMTHPRIGVVLNVGSAHVGEFGSRDNIARAKGELVAALPAGGLAVLNGDDPLVAAMPVPDGVRTVFTGRGSGPAEGGDEANPDRSGRVTAADVRVDDLGAASFTLRAGGPDGTGVPVTLGVLGEHQVDNALAVAAVALEVGMALPDVAAALGQARLASRWRMERHERADGVSVVNDAYNANPESMAGALRTLARMGGARRTWAVLGAMLELGPSGPDLHREIGSLAHDLGIDEVLAVGADARPVQDGAAAGRTPTRARWVRDTQEAYAVLEDELRAGDVVLVKSSRDAGLRDLGDRLVESGGRGGRDDRTARPAGRAAQDEVAS